MHPLWCDDKGPPLQALRGTLLGVTHQPAGTQPFMAWLLTCYTHGHQASIVAQHACRCSGLSGRCVFVCLFFMFGIALLKQFLLPLMAFLLPRGHVWCCFSHFRGHYPCSFCPNSVPDKTFLVVGRFERHAFCTGCVWFPRVVGEPCDGRQQI